MPTKPGQADPATRDDQRPGEAVSGERLQKVLARAGVASRRTIEALIEAGRVVVNGEVVRAQGVRVDAARDVIAVDGRAIPLAPERPETWALHKPPGMLTTLNDPQGRPTIRRLVADVRLRLYPVGRLDWDASGLLLVSNDGDLVHRLTHPRFGVPRTYCARVKGRVEADTLERLRGEVQLEDGPVRALAVVLDPALADARDSTLTLTVAEGRNHLIKRLCAAVGHEVSALVRLSYGGVQLADLPSGGRRLLSGPELEALRQVAGAAP